MTGILDLFDPDAPAMTPSERKRLYREAAKEFGKPKGLFAAEPGTGPAGETCGTCLHLYRRRMSKTYLKCALVNREWTGGSATDVKASTPACLKWEAR